MTLCHACQQGVCTYIKKTAARHLMKAFLETLLGIEIEDDFKIGKNFDPVGIMDEFKHCFKLLQMGINIDNHNYNH